MRAILLSLVALLTAMLAFSGCSDTPTDIKKNDDHYLYTVIRDYQYLENTYFDLTRRDTIFSDADLQDGDSITYLELYYSVTTYNHYVTQARACSLFVDPFNKTKYPNESTGDAYLAYGIDPNAGTYVFHPTEHYLVMERPMSGISIGVYMRYKRPGVDDEIEVGSRPNEGTYTLKLIVALNPQPYYVTWNYVWRNVYSLGGTISNLDSFDVRIYKGDATNIQDKDASDLDHQHGEYYINLLGLDKNNDNRIDAYDRQIIDPVRGNLRIPETANLPFPQRRMPFANPVLNEPVDSIYSTNVIGNRILSSKYYFVIKVTQPPVL